MVCRLAVLWIGSCTWPAQTLALLLAMAVSCCWVEHRQAAAGEKVLVLSVWDPLPGSLWAKTKRNSKKVFFPVSSISYNYHHFYYLPSNLSEPWFCSGTIEKLKRAVLTWGPHIQWVFLVRVIPQFLCLMISPFVLLLRRPPRMSWWGGPS